MTDALNDSVERQVVAYNDHDVDAFAGCCSGLIEHVRFLS
jgi:hypothetical protein